MKVVKFEEVREEIVSHFQRGMLIPIIGSGFTRNCASKRGTVPSGQDYKAYMIEEVKTAMDLQESDCQSLINSPFSVISEYYFSVEKIQPEKRREYIKDHFTEVRLEDNKKEFLNLMWPYIYTLNIDDGIERNSQYSHCVLPNRLVEDRIFDEASCVIKLHGDANDMITYQDAYTVLTQRQYIESLRKNSTLLTKLEHDSVYENLLFVGCSLDDEMDLLAYGTQRDKTIGLSARYYCTTRQPTGLFYEQLKHYGITCCIVFDDYDSMYEKITDAGVEAQEVRADDLSYFKQSTTSKMSDSFEDNKPYYLFGKSLLAKDNRTLCLPYYFISRDVTERVLNRLHEEPIQLIIGGGCSGKTYILADIARRVRDLDVFLFESKDRLSEAAFDKLTEKKNCLVLADDNSLTYTQIEYLLDNMEKLTNNNLHIVIVAKRRDNDLNSLIRLREQLGFFPKGSIPQYEVNGVLSPKETKKIIPLLTATEMGVYHDGKTILDNIIDMGDKLKANYKYRDVHPKMSTVKDIAVLIALATEKKIYSQELIALDLYQEMQSQIRTTQPLIDSESTWAFEISKGDNSPVKYVVNAEYWLNRQLMEYSTKKANKKKIADAYRYIIEKQIENYGSPKLLYGDNRSEYRNYIKFDIINQIFGAVSTSASQGKDGLSLIRYIYESLNELLSVDPNYMHQRAKCYIKSARYEPDDKKKIYYLDKAYRDTNVAMQVFSRRYEESHSEKLLISLDHATYTMALSLCHKCNIQEYQDAKTINQAVVTLHKALISKNNSYDFALTDAFNYQNVVKKLVTTLLADYTLVDSDSRQLLQELFKIISG